MKRPSLSRGSPLLFSNPNGITSAFPSHADHDRNLSFIRLANDLVNAQNGVANDIAFGPVEPFGQVIELGALLVIEPGWSALMGRQHQRYAIELFLWCFEVGLDDGARSLDDVIGFWSDRTAQAGKTLKGTFAGILKKCAGSLFHLDELATSSAWNAKVHAGDGRFEYISEPQDEEAILNGLQMIAGWYWRMLVRQQEPTTKELMSLGGSDRMSMSWFIKWLKDREDLPIANLLKDIFSDLVFAQHMRIALARFDGTAQRLRFLLGDGGIEPTVSARSDLAKLALPWMPDRLDTLIALLCDCDVLEMTGKTLTPGNRANEVLAMENQRS